MSLKEGSLDIVVVGGSLGGLFAAIPLLRMPQKHKVTILERSGTPLLHDQGAGIVAGQNVQRWLDKFESFGVITGVSGLYLVGCAAATTPIALWLRGFVSEAPYAF